MSTVVIVGNTGCGRCTQAIQVCESKGIPYVYKKIHDDITVEALELIVGGRVASVPQVFISEDGLNTYLGGFKEFQTYAANYTNDRVDLDVL